MGISVYYTHMLNLNSIMLGSDDVQALAVFYEKVVGKKPDMQEGEWFGWTVGSTFLAVGSHSAVKGKAKNPERMMFTFETKDVKAEFDRIMKAGASAIKEPYQMGDATIATLADPDGNYFQLMTPWE